MRIGIISKNCTKFIANRFDNRGHRTYWQEHEVNFISLGGLYRGSEKSETNGNFNYFSYFYLQVKVKG
jgi:hypothetical protein